MDGKKIATRFNIIFSETDPSHLLVAEILSRQGHRGKAQYLVNAVLHYEGYIETPGAKRPARFDEKIIEAVINRIMKDKAITVSQKPVDAVVDINENTVAMLSEDITFDDALVELSEDGLNAVLGALEMFRQG